MYNVVLAQVLQASREVAHKTLCLDLTQWCPRPDLRCRELVAVHVLAEVQVTILKHEENVCFGVQRLEKPHDIRVLDGLHHPDFRLDIGFLFLVHVPT